jgi:Xaa-Pro aminopeptidase
MSARVARLRAWLQAQELAAVLVTKRENIFYLSGFRGTAGMLILTPERNLLVSDFRYELQSAAQAPAWEFVLAEETIPQTVRSVLAGIGGRVGFAPAELSVVLWQELGGYDTGLPYGLVAAPDGVETLRLRKEPEELDRIRTAVQVTDAAYAHILPRIVPGVSERDLALEVEWHMRQHGAEAAAFDVIAATGAHSALPHATPGDRRLQPGDLLVLDFGARVAGYNADLTRTVAVAEATPTAQTIYRICWEAQQVGLQGAQPGGTGRDLDAVVRASITAAGYGAYFGHGTGHGVGVEVHEAPRLNRLSDQVLAAGMTVTIEPGIYLPGIGGVRIEDLICLTDTGCEVLSTAAKPAELPVVG